MSTFHEIKEQITEFPQLFGQNEGLIENSFRERGISEEERKELLIMLLEIEYGKIPIAKYPSLPDYNNDVIHPVRLENKVVSIFPDFNLIIRIPFKEVIMDVVRDTCPAYRIIFQLYSRLRKSSKYNKMKLEHLIVIYAFVLELFVNGYTREIINSELSSGPLTNALWSTFLHGREPDYAEELDRELSNGPSDYSLRIAKLLNEALDLLPNHRDEIKGSYPTQRLPEASFHEFAVRLENRFRVGQTFMIRYFLLIQSSSGEPYFIITHKTGKDISNFFPPYRHETLFLFKIGTRFQVTSINKYLISKGNVRDGITILLKEL